MATFVRTASFSTTGKWNHQKDNKEVNSILDKLRDKGAKIQDIKIALAGLVSGAIIFYLITYKAPTPIT